LGIGIKIAIVGFGALVAAAGYEAYQVRVMPEDVALAQTAVSQDIARQVVAAFPATSRWSKLEIVSVSRNEYRLALSYLPGTASDAEIEFDAREVAQEMALHLSMAGHHPDEERTVIEVTAREGKPGEDGALVGTIRFDAPHDRFLFERGG
jgi:hypothetical protein